MFNQAIEWFSFECWKVIGFPFATLHDWLKIFTPIFHPIRSKTKTNCDSLALVFLHFASATCNYFKFWLVHCIVCVLCDWLGNYFGFGFTNTENHSRPWFIGWVIVSMLYRLINYTGIFIEHKNLEITCCRRGIYEFFECFTNIPSGLPDYKP